MCYALVVFATVILAQSQPPSPTPGKAGEKKQDQVTPKSSKAATDNDSPNPNIFNGVTVITSREQKQSGKENESKAPTDWWAIINTGLVTIFTGALAILARLQWRTLEAHKSAFDQLAKHMGEGLEETKKAADAATKSAEVAERSLQVSQRAIVGIDSIKLKFEGGERHGTPINTLVISYVELVVKNSGPTIAPRCYFEFRISIDGSSENPAPVVTHPTSLNPGQTIGELSDTLGKLFPHHSEIAGGFMRGEIPVNGFIRYKDIFGNGTYVDFSSSLDPKNWEFRIAQDVRPDGE